jgi:prephenate dehydrogenase
VHTAGILGTGLIGSSIGMGLRQAGWRVQAWDADPDSLSIAVERGAVDEAVPDEAAVGSSCDLLVIALPPAATCEAITRVEPDVLAIDVAGVKSPVVAAAAGQRFVGTHPMAGREVSGPRAATATLFNGAAWVITTDGAAEGDMALVEGAVRSLGARPIRMTAEEHDELVAAISHVPQLLAAALVTEAVGSDGALDLAAGSFRDLTRVAASDPALWIEVLGANRAAVIAMLERFRMRLDAFEASLGDSVELGRLLATAREARTSLTARVTAVSIALADRPGELAKVGTALQDSGVDVRDIQLRHSPHGGGGVLTISVRPGDGDRLRAGLEASGLLVID